MRSAAPEAKPLRVVIVDDTADLRELLRMALVRGGMSVVAEAGDGLAGIEAVRTGRPDVVLLDLSMPVMDGLEALPHMRALAPDAHIIVLSGFGATQMSERALAIGADGYLQKGASLGRILDQIRDIVDGRVIQPVSHAIEPMLETEPFGQGLDRSGRIALQRGETGIGAWDPLALAPFGVIEVSDEAPYRISRMNQAAQALLERNAVVGAPLHASARELAAAVTNNRLRGDIEFEASVQTKPVQVTLRHTRGSLLLYLRDITDEVGVLRTAIATTAHEIRGPVSVLCAVAETLADAAGNDLDDMQQQRLMSSVARQARMLDSITADLLTAAQIQRGTLRIDAHDVDPHAVIGAVIEDRYAGAVRFEVTDHRKVVADPLRLEQMIGNLLSNAHKYGAPPIVLRIRSCVEQPDQVCIDVEDAGIGVPAEFSAHLFREFSRASGTAAAGTGLGLHVVRTLAQAQGGSISYRPGAAGGSVFTLTLPASRSG